MFNECRKVAITMKDFKCEWGFAGGWALDLFQGRETREHHDVEIVVFRKNQQDLKEYLKDWEFSKVIKGEFHPWQDEYLELPVHEIHAIHKSTGELLEVLLNEEIDDRWVYRRDSRISIDHQSAFGKTEDGIPYLKSEIVLLYKAKNSREKDDLDFYKTLSYLNESQKKWLKGAIELSIPNHKWLASL